MFHQELGRSKEEDCSCRLWLDAIDAVYYLVAYGCGYIGIYIEVMNLYNPTIIFSLHEMKNLIHRQDKKSEQLDGCSLEFFQLHG